MERGMVLLILVLVAAIAYKVYSAAKQPQRGGWKTNGAPIIRGQVRL